MGSEPRQRVAVVHDSATAPEQLEEFKRACAAPCECFTVGDAAELQKVVQHIYAAGASVYGPVVNLCTDRTSGGTTAALAALFFDHASLPYTGCRAATLAYPFDILLMMLSYAEVPLPPFAIVDSAEAAASAARRLRAPVQIRSTRALFAIYRERCERQDDVAAALTRAFHEQGKVVVWEVSTSRRRAMRVLVAGGAVKGAAAAVPLERHDDVPTWAAQAGEAARQCGAAVSRYVLYHCGVATLTLNTLDGESDRWCFEDLQLNPDAAHLVSSEAASNLLTPAPTAAELVACLLEEARQRRPAPTFEIRLHEDSRKGYHLCATAALRKGDVVFEDECRNFAVVTRPHVERHWDGPLKKTFTEYAWPLDSEGHLYAIWEEDPQRWRPINHSCNPNCIFAAPHSLNVIAARDVAAGEDLSMDYATFCDTTMKPFQCLCGADCCRGLIHPDAASLAKYGEHAWLRRVPPSLKPLIS
ncbi:SET domain protein [Novymonas esmeraldas]|uniref:SET domain protein n=1 Tax=Novymonas esmeraldas TaxID=1808958 RepID=A0AAW0EUP2_9TRYP